MKNEGITEREIKQQKRKQVRSVAAKGGSERVSFGVPRIDVMGILASQANRDSAKRSKMKKKEEAEELLRRRRVACISGGSCLHLLRILHDL